MKRNESKLTNIFVIAWVHDHYVIVVLKYIMCAFTERILLNKILKVIWDENSNLSFLNYWSSNCLRSCLVVLFALIKMWYKAKNMFYLSNFHKVDALLIYRVCLYLVEKHICVFHPNCHKIQDLTTKFLCWLNCVHQKM